MHLRWCQFAECVGIQKDFHWDVKKESGAIENYAVLLSVSPFSFFLKITNTIVSKTTIYKENNNILTSCWSRWKFYVPLPLRVWLLSTEHWPLSNWVNLWWCYFLHWNDKLFENVNLYLHTLSMFYIKIVLSLLYFLSISALQRRAHTSLSQLCTE